MITSGVYPVFENSFRIGINGKTSTSAQMKTIADMTSFSVSMDNGIEEWTPMTTGGWIRRLMTAKGFSITLSGKRNVGDAGNDYAAGMMWKTGQDTESVFEWIFADGTVVRFDCIVNVTTAGGESTNAESLEVTVLSNGKPSISLAQASVASLDDITIGIGSAVSHKLSAQPDGVTFSAEVVQTIGSSSALSATVSGENIVLVCNGDAVAGDIFTVTVTASKSGLGDGTMSFTVTVQQFN